ncbi:unnamed protein product [Adineta steineri]|uniref:Uncharacterized protein n=1 Tax=Adineta steineri TaxID=433720 RepID=A0A815TJZ6_9BILA|nr:unnamed protein product [Adineta steineri]CAF1509643.1 unnamed protein product [Adineta steineri]CAF4118675.1 unnamed protein product [Adineta steineri]CAF4123440.1 unnamed protein product [Adineta steineri]
MSDFYTIETPPSSSSTSKDSLDESISLYQTNERIKLVPANLGQISNQSNSLEIKIDEFCVPLYDDMNTPLRRSLGNTKLKTRQDVRRFRKFLKRNYNLLSTSLIDIDPDTMRKYLIDYLTSIRTRKGSKYDPETLRSYYLSIQRYLKDSNYPYCLRNSPQFSQCRDLIIQMRKEKNQVKINQFSSYQKNGIISKKFSTPINQNNQQILQNRINSSSNTCIDLLPISSLPPRKRQQIKYFLESNSSCNLYLYTQIPRTPSPSPLSTLSLDAYLLLIQFISSSQSKIHYFEQLLDQSPACGNKQRLMLTTLCHQWTGDIRIIHANLRPELNSFLPHILLINILSRKY